MGIKLPWVNGVVLDTDDWDSWPDDAKKIVDRHGSPIRSHRKYPWNEWSDGNWHTVDLEAMDVSRNTLTTSMYSYAKRHKLQVETQSFTVGEDKVEHLRFMFATPYQKTVAYVETVEVTGPPPQK